MPTTYIGKVRVGDDYIPIGSTMLGKCTYNSNNPNVNTAESANKIVKLPGYDNPSDGLLISVKFDKGNTVTENLTLTVDGEIFGQTPSAVPVIGNALCDEGDILSFVYESGSNDNSRWHVLYGSLRNKLEEVDVTVNNLSANLSGLEGAMHFKGEVNAAPVSDYNSFTTYNSGDVVLGPDHKEYVYKKGDSVAESEWIELGDEGNYMLKSTYNDDTDITYLNYASGSTARNPALSIGSEISNITSSGSVVTGMANITNADQDPPVVLTGAANVTFNIPAGTTFNISGGVLTLTHINASTISAVDAEHISSKKLVTTPIYFDPGSHPSFTQTTVNDIVTKVQQQNAGG